MNMRNLKALLTLGFTASFVLSPLATAPFQGFRADQLPLPQIDPPVQPAGYAFAIWGMIYLWLVVSAVYGLLRRRDAAHWDHVRGPLIVSLALGTPWLALANVNAIGASVLIVAMAAFAIAALLRAPATDRWWLRAPVGIYAGWLTAASCVAVATVAAGHGLVFGAFGWAIAGVICALVVASAVQWRSAGPSYGLTVIWALIGIIVTNGANQISILAAAGIAIMLALVLRRRLMARVNP
jgi:hypothetical protein